MLLADSTERGFDTLLLYGEGVRRSRFVSSTWFGRVVLSSIFGIDFCLFKYCGSVTSSTSFTVKDMTLRPI